MIFYDATKKLGVCQVVDRLCDSDDTSYPLLDKRSQFNISGESLAAELINQDGTYQWDDTNNTDQPRGRGTLVEGQEPYTFASDYLQITQVDVLDVGDYWRRLTQIDHDDLGGMTPEEWFGSTQTTTKTGMPTHYDLFADDSFRLYPAPTASEVTLASGFRVWFKRTFKIFDDDTLTNDYTKTPGLPSPYHYLLALMIALPYCMTYKKDRVAFITSETEKERKKLMKHYNDRNKDKRDIIKTKSKSYK